MSSRRLIVLPILIVLLVLAAACAPVPVAPGLAPAATAIPPATEPPTETPPAPDLSTALPAATEVISPTAPLTPTVAVAATVAVTPTLVAPVDASPVITDTTAPVTAPAVEMTTYRDDLGGFEFDYPATWSIVDVSHEIKEKSLAYSITIMSWQPQEPGGQGIPEGGSKLDIVVNKGGAATPEEAVEMRRQEIAANAMAGEISFEEPWELAGGLAATHWTIHPPQDEVIHELVTAINGNQVFLSGVGDPALFEQIAMSLRAMDASVEAPAAKDTAADTTAAAAPASAAAAAADTPESTAMDESAARAEVQPLAATIYTVRQGDTLGKIAARFGVTVAAILRANPQITNPDRIFIGQRITIPSPGGTQPPPPATTTRVNIYMISMGGGSVGCGDGVVAVRRDIPKTPAPLTAALNLLLSQKSQYYGESGLYNALYQSNLRIGSISRSGTAWTIRLTGSLVLGGVCDNPRVKAQLDSTALQFSTVKSVRYFINGQPLESLLSGR